MNNKMSFKSYILKENSSANKPFLSISTNYWTSEFDESELSKQFNNSRSEFTNWITNEFINYFNNNTIDIYFDEEGELVITIDLDYHILDDNNIKEYTNKLGYQFGHLMDIDLSKNSIKTSDAILVFREQIPKGVITNHPRIMISGYNVPSFTLEGIEKNGPNAKIIIFYHCEKTITGNVLGLLKIKSLQKIWTWPKTSIKWFDIVEKHLNGNRDIIECQEELIDAGLKDFAEL